MQRHRDLAGSPVRSASEVWTTLSQLIVDTLVRSPHITESQITTALAAAAPAGMMLTAAGHLESNSIVLVADRASAVDRHGQRRQRVLGGGKPQPGTRRSGRS